MSRLKLNSYFILRLSGWFIAAFYLTVPLARAERYHDMQVPEEYVTEKFDSAKATAADNRIWWTPLRLGIWEDISWPDAQNVGPLNLCVGENPFHPAIDNMFGLSIGGIYSCKNIYGFMFSLIGVGGAENNYGLVFNGSIAFTQNNYGVNFGCLGGLAEAANYGVTAAVVWTGIKHNYGLIAGGVLAGSTKGSNYGALISPLITFTEENHFLQLGVFNWADKGQGLQLGLLNYNGDGFLPWFPIFNF